MIDIIKKSFICLLAGCILCAAGPSALAETSAASIEITAGTGPTLPVNPENPEEEITGGTPVEGSLVILSVSDFNFGTITAAGVAGLHNITTYQPNIQIADLRGTGTGWSVSASVSGFTSGGSPSLQGAVIHIYSGRPNSAVSALFAPTQVANVELTTDNNPVKVITAADGKGMGLWVMRWYPDTEETGAAYIQLEIPAGVARVGTHRATITWTLSNTP